MAIAPNLNRPRGLIPLSRGSSNTAVVDAFLPFDSAGGTLGPDVAFVIGSNGCVSPATAASNNPIHGTVVQCLNTNRQVIRAAGGGTNDYLTTGNQGYCAVHMGYPGRRFVVQTDSAGTALTAAAVGENIDLISNGFDTGPRQMATGQANEASHGTGATRQLRIISLLDEVQSYNIFESAGGGYTDWAHNAPLVVEINNYSGPPLTAGI